MQALFPTYATRADRLNRYKQLLAQLRGLASNAEHDDVPVLVEIDGMKFWMTQELMAMTGRGSTYEAAPAYVHRHVLDCVITATHLLRLWTNRPSVLQGSSAAARLVTSVVLSYVGFPWEGPSLAKVRRHALTPGFLAAYVAAYEGLAAGLDKARCTDVPQHVAEMAVVLLWTWRAAMDAFGSGAAMADPAMKSLLLPVVQLAVAALRCWAGPTAGRSDPHSKAIDAAVDVSVLLVKGAADITNSLRQQHSGEPIMTLMYKGFAKSHEVQWLLCCYVALIAQELHRQLQGRQPAVLPKTGTSKLQEQQQSGQQQQQQERVRVTPVHKRLLEGLCVPGLIDWDYAGHTSTMVWQEPQAHAAVLACAVFNSQLAYLNDSSGSGRVRPQKPTRDPPLLTATVHLRRAAVLLELCLLFPELNVLLLSLQCIQKEVECMYHCLFWEVGSDSATWTRVYAAVTTGIMPTLLQQLLPVLARVLQLAVQEQVADRTGYSRAAAELGTLLAGVIPGQHCLQQQQLLAAMQQPSSARALESSIRCWVHMHAMQPGCLPEPHQDLMLMQRLAHTTVFSAPPEAFAAPPAAAAVAKPAGLYSSSECFALCVTCLKACVFAANERVEQYPESAAASSGSSSSSSKFFSYKRVAVALLEAILTADAAMAACRSLSGSSSSSSSSKALMLPAWQLLLAHSLHATGQMVLLLHSDGVLPSPSQQHRQQLDALKLLGSLSAALAAVPSQLASTQHPAAAAAQGSAQGSAQKMDPYTTLLQQHETLSGSIEQLTAGATSSSKQSRDTPSSTAGLTALEMMMGLKATVSAELAQQLVDFGSALSGCFACKLCCNAPGCSSLARFSELEVVGGKSCMCGRCKTARYCCRGCQEAHWKAHKHACRALAAQRQQQ